MMIDSPQNKLLFFLFLIISLTISCSTKLPSDKSLVEDFTKNADEYEKLVKLFKENGILAIRKNYMKKLYIDTLSVENGNYSLNRCYEDLTLEPYPIPNNTPNPNPELRKQEIVSKTLKFVNPINNSCPSKETWDYFQAKLKELTIQSIDFERNQAISFSKFSLEQEASDGVMMNYYYVSYIYQPKTTTKLVDSTDVITNKPESDNFYRKLNDDWYILVDKSYDFAIKPE